jgi:hypothetical protein
MTESRNRYRYTDADIANQSDYTKGAALVGYKTAWADSIGRTLSAKQQDSVSVKDFGATGDGVTDDAPAIQNGIDFVIGQGGGTLHFPAGTYQIGAKLSISKAGDANITLQGAGKGTQLRTNLDIILIEVTSPSEPISYALRVQHVYIRDMHLYQQSANTGTGLRIERWAFIGVDNVHIERFEIGLDMFQGSEGVVKNVRASSGPTGIKLMRDTSVAYGDLANLLFIGCNVHSCGTQGVLLDGVRQVVFYGGALVASAATVGAVLAKGTIASIDCLIFDNVNFENEAANSAIQIGSADGIRSVGLVNFSRCQFAKTADEKIVVHSRLSVMNILGCNVDVTNQPFVSIRSTQATEPRINIDDCSPAYTRYSILDGRSVVAKTALGLHRGICVNAFNKDFTSAWYGYTPNITPTVDATAYVTGICSLLFPSGAAGYMDYTFKNEGATAYGYPGDVFTIDYIAKWGSGLSGILFAVTTDLAGADLQVTTVSPTYTVFALQGFDGAGQPYDGFGRRFVEYIVPAGRRLQGFRLSNQSDQSSNLYIDYLSIHSTAIPPNYKIYSATNPAAGTFTKGKRVYNSDTDTAEFEGWCCTVAGSPGTWKGFGVIA